MEIEKYIEFGKINAVLNLDSLDFNFREEIHVLRIKPKYKNINVKKYLLEKTSCLEERMLSSLKLVHMEEDILEKKMNVLSTSEKVKVELAVLLIQNVNCIVFNKFDSYFMEKELLFFKKLFLKLVKKYKKTFVFVNSDLSFLFDFVNHLVVKKSKKDYLVLEDPNFYEEELYSIMDCPPIVDFVKYLNEQGKKILPYIDLKELLKAIFREV